jgi:hypothetical protein
MFKRCVVGFCDTKMTADVRVLDSPEKIAEAGELIYAERYQAQLDPDQRGHFIAVDVTSGEGYVADYPEQALQKARTASPSGIFHLIRIGAPGAFRVSFGLTRHDFWGRPLRQSR